MERRPAAIQMSGHGGPSKSRWSSGRAETGAGQRSGRRLSWKPCGCRISGAARWVLDLICASFVARSGSARAAARAFGWLMMPARPSATAQIDGPAVTLFPLDRDDLERLGAARRGDFGGVAFFFADHRARDRGRNRDLLLLNVGLVLAHDFVDEGFVGVLVGHGDGGAELDGLAVELGRIDDVGARELVFELRHTTLDEGLALLGGVILRVLGQVAMAARFRN